MKDIAHQLRSVIRMAEPKLSRMNHDDTGFKPDPHEWSKKEILGHLIDSAANNHQRFVRAVNKMALKFPTYDQDEWVKIQRFNERSWQALVTLWSAYNNHLIHVIECIPKDAESSPCNFGEEQVPLDSVVKHYLSHLQHHLHDILGED